MSKDEIPQNSYQVFDLYDFIHVPEDGSPPFIIKTPSLVREYAEAIYKGFQTAETVGNDISEEFKKFNDAFRKKIRDMTWENNNYPPEPYQGFDNQQEYENLINWTKDAEKINTDFVFLPGQVLYKGQDLNVGGTAKREIFEILHKNIGHVVKHKSLQDITVKAPNYIVDLRKLLEDQKIPFKIHTITREGYKLERL